MRPANYITIAAAARILNQSPASIANLVDAGELGTFEQQGVTYVSLADLRAVAA